MWSWAQSGHAVAKSPVYLVFITPYRVPSSLRVPLHPVRRILVELLAVGLELVRDLCLNSIIRLRSLQHRPDQLQNIHDLVRRLPLVGAEDAETHGAAVVVGDVGVVDFRAEGEGGWFERVFFRYCEGMVSGWRVGR